jgi:chromosome segregation ATPase
MKQILIFNFLLICSISLAKAQDETETFNITAEEETTENSPSQEYEEDSNIATEEYAASNTGAVVVVVDTLLPVRKSFIRRANIIFKDRDRLRAETIRLRSEIASLNQDITKKTKQIKELTDYVNNQTFAVNEAKKSEQKCKDEAAELQSDIDLLNDDLARCGRSKIWWTVGGVVVGV